MRQGLQDINWAHAGALLAAGDSNDQVTFFRSFVKECLSWGARHAAESQLAFVNNELTAEEKELLSMIGYREGDEGR